MSPSAWKVIFSLKRTCRSGFALATGVLVGAAGLADLPAGFAGDDLASAAAVPTAGAAEPDRVIKLAKSI